MSRKANLTEKQKKAVALRKMEGKSWPEIQEETGLAQSSIARILRDPDTRQFINELRIANADQLSEMYALTLSTINEDLRKCEDPLTRIKIRRHAMQVLTMENNGRGGDRSKDSPLVSIDNRQNGGYSLREMLDAIRTPPQKEDIN